MDFNERVHLVRRICSGRLYGIFPYANEHYLVSFKDPSIDILTESDWVYKKTFDHMKETSYAFTLEESYEILKKEGKWSDAMEKELQGISKDIETLQDGMAALRFNKSATRQALAKIDKGKKRIEELFGIKNQLRAASIDFMAEKARKRFIISKICTLENQELLDVHIFKDALVVYYFEESGIAESKLRELARSEPWRLYWTTSKDTGTPLFPHSAVEMTELQCALLYWTRVYDFAFNSMNRPTDDVIHDDGKFDSWYRAEIKRIESETAKHAVGELGQNFGSQEIFIPADAEGAKEVYQLNDLQAKTRIKQRQQAIEKRGQVPEQGLPDVDRDLKMEANRLASEGIQNRRK